MDMDKTTYIGFTKTIRKILSKGNNIMCKCQMPLHKKLLLKLIFRYKCKIKVGTVWIWTHIPSYRERLLSQMCHNHCSLTI